MVHVGALALHDRVFTSASASAVTTANNRRIPLQMCVEAMLAVVRRGSRGGRLGRSEISEGVETLGRLETESMREGNANTVQRNATGRRTT
jgi:hypothetical protein